MQTVIETAIKELAEKAGKATESFYALKFAQAAAHLVLVAKEMKATQKEPVSTGELIPAFLSDKHWQD